MMLMSRQLDSAIASFGCLKTPRNVQICQRGQQALPFLGQLPSLSEGTVSENLAVCVRMRAGSQ